MSSSLGASYKETCIVLKKTKLKETDLILTMLASDGSQVKGVAKGARKPGNKRFGARLEPFGVVDLQLYPGRSLETITDARCVQANQHCREDLDRAAACSLMAEFTAKSIQDGELDERVFAMLRRALAVIDAGDPAQALLLAEAYLLKAVSMMGLRPAIHACALCGSPLGEPAVFDVVLGGALCPACSFGAEAGASLALVKWVDLLIMSTFDRLTGVRDAPTQELLGFCSSWISEHTGIRLKSIAFLRL